MLIQGSPPTLNTTGVQATIHCLTTSPLISEYIFIAYTLEDLNEVPVQEIQNKAMASCGWISENS